MGGKHGAGFGAEYARRIALEAEEMIGDAALGRASWQAVCAFLAESLPGSALSMTAYDLTRKAVHRTFSHGVDPAYLESYISHYSHVNPWMDYWAGAPGYWVSVSERDCPSSLLRGSEFYDDWLVRQENMDAAAGIRLDVNRQETVHISWNYARAHAGAYDRAAELILDRLKLSLAGAVELSGKLRDSAEAGLRDGALVGRLDDLAALVDGDRRIIDANQAAADAFHGSNVVSGRDNILTVLDRSAQRWLEETVHALAARAPITSGDHIFSAGDRVFRLSAIAVPARVVDYSDLLVSPRRLVLVTLRMLAGETFKLDRTSLRTTFGLSEAEIRLCELLVNGRSLQEASKLLEVTEGTARQRVKAIFHKTRTHRQGELISMLARMRAF